MGGDLGGVGERRLSDDHPTIGAIDTKLSAVKSAST
jgi:hypothetical protein